MRKLQNNFTTPEQSRKLLELGVPADSADFYFDKDEVEIDERPYPYFIPQSKSFINYSTDFYIPCWSVGRLIEIGNICSIPKIKEAGFHLLAQDFDDLIETMIISIKIKVEHNWMDFSKLEG